MSRESSEAGENASPAAGFARQSAITQQEEKAIRLERGFQRGLMEPQARSPGMAPGAAPAPFGCWGALNGSFLSRAGAALGGLYSGRLMPWVCSVPKANTPGGGGCPAQTWDGVLSPGLMVPKWDVVFLDAGSQASPVCVCVCVSLFQPLQHPQ